jgi:hypothetical protein
MAVKSKETRRTAMMDYWNKWKSDKHQEKKCTGGKTNDRDKEESASYSFHI